MGLDKFLNDEKEEVVLSKKNYKSKVNEMVKNTFEKESLNLLNMESEEVSTKKVPMSIYFNKEDLDLLKAIAFEKNTTVNKILMSIIKEPLGVTRNNLPDSFDVTEKAAQYEVKSKKRNKEEDNGQWCYINAILMAIILYFYIYLLYKLSVIRYTILQQFINQLLTIYREFVVNLFRIYSKTIKTFNFLFLISSFLFLL